MFFVVEVEASSVETCGWVLIIFDVVTLVKEGVNISGTEVINIVWFFEVDGNEVVVIVVLLSPIVVEVFEELFVCGSVDVEVVLVAVDEEGGSFGEVNVDDVVEVVVSGSVVLLVEAEEEDE